jgi:hypothetical protein
MKPFLEAYYFKLHEHQSYNGIVVKVVACIIAFLVCNQETVFLTA